jgi:hypothetical protein
MLQHGRRVLLQHQSDLAREDQLDEPNTAGNWNLKSRFRKPLSTRLLSLSILPLQPGLTSAMQFYFLGYHAIEIVVAKTATEQGAQSHQGFEFSNHCEPPFTEENTDVAATTACSGLVFNLLHVDLGSERHSCHRHSGIFTEYPERAMHVVQQQALKAPTFFCTRTVLVESASYQLQDRQSHCSQAQALPAMLTAGKGMDDEDESPRQRRMIPDALDPCVTGVDAPLQQRFAAGKGRMPRACTGMQRCDRPSRAGCRSHHQST